MPDLHLDERLRAARARLLDDIDQPDLSRVTGRAATIRRRRFAGRAGGAALVLAAVAVVALRPWAGGPNALPDEVATTPDPTPANFTVYTESGVTVNGLVLGQDIADVPGEVRDVDFLDPDRGWALSAKCPSSGSGLCELAIASTTNGGLSWAVRSIHGYGVGVGSVPDLVMLDPKTLLLHGHGKSLLSTDGGENWATATSEEKRVPAAGKGDRLLLRRSPAPDCAGGAVEVWSPGGTGGLGGNRGDLAGQPPLHVCWVAPTAAADGGWWVGGVDPATGAPALAVSHDGGSTWRPARLDGAPAGRAMVSWAGRHTYAVVVSGDGAAPALRAIYHSATLGAPFVRTWLAEGRAPREIAGELVATLDGRLVVATGKRWYVSTDDGVSFGVLGTDKMPMIGGFARTQAGYVAFDIVASGWPAFSSDGATWRKLHVH